MYKKIISVMSVALVVFLCSFSIYADSVGAASRYGLTTTYIDDGTHGSVASSLSLTSFNAYQSLDPNVNTPSDATLWECDVLGYLTVFNRDTLDVTFITHGSGTTNNKLYFNIQQVGPAAKSPNNPNTNYVNWELSDVEYMGGQLNISYITNTSEFVFEKIISTDIGMPSAIVIPGSSNICSYFKLHYTAMVPNDYTLYNPAFNSTSVSATRNNYQATYANVNYNYYTYIPDIYDALLDIYSREGTISNQLQQILNSYNANVPASQNVTSDAGSASTTIGNQHQQETNIYNQTNQAIGSTGIQNFQFDSQTIGGLGGVKNDFTAVWNSLGTFNSVFITSLTIGLALSIVRHRRMFKQ